MDQNILTDYIPSVLPASIRIAFSSQVDLVLLRSDPCESRPCASSAPGV